MFGVAGIIEIIGSVMIRARALHPLGRVDHIRRDGVRVFHLRLPTRSIAQSSGAQGSALLSNSDDVHCPAAHRIA